MQQGFSIRDTPRKTLKVLIFTVWLSLWIQTPSCLFTSGEVTASAGENVTLQAGPIIARFISWHRGNRWSEENLIIRYYLVNSSQTTGPEYTGRETGQSRGNMHIRNVQTSDTGIYTVTYVYPNSPHAFNTEQLRVYAYYLNCYTCANQPRYENCTTPEQCETTAKFCQTTVATVAGNLNITKKCVTDCTPSESPEKIECCNKNLCNKSGANGLKISSTLFSVALAASILLLRAGL